MKERLTILVGMLVAFVVVIMIGLTGASSTVEKVAAGPGGGGGGPGQSPLPTPRAAWTSTYTTFMPIAFNNWSWSTEHWGLYFECFNDDPGEKEECRDTLFELLGGEEWRNLMIWDYRELALVPTTTRPSNLPWYNIWMRQTPTDTLLPSEYPVVSAAMVSWLELHPEGKIHLGNEPNAKPSMNVLEVITPCQYAEFAYEWGTMLREVSTDVILSLAGMGSIYNDLADNYSPTYLEDVYDCWDAAYTEPFTMFTWVDQHFYHTAQAQDMLDDMIDWRDLRLPGAGLMVSEFGMPTTRTIPADQMEIVYRMDFWEDFFLTNTHKVNGPVLYYANYNPSLIFRESYLTCDDESTYGTPNDPLWNNFRCIAAGDCPADTSGDFCDWPYEWLMDGDGGEESVLLSPLPLPLPED